MICVLEIIKLNLFMIYWKLKNVSEFKLLQNILLGLVF